MTIEIADEATFAAPLVSETVTELSFTPLADLAAGDGTGACAPSTPVARPLVDASFVHRGGHAGRAEPGCARG